MRRVLTWAALAAVAAFSLMVAAQPGAPLDPEEKVTSVASGLRCPVCQGLSVADSDSETARALRADIARRLDAGQSPAEIRQAYVDRYGEWVLLRPRNTGFGSIVWLAPPVTAAVGAAVVVVALWRWRRRGRTRATTDDRRMVEAALGHPLSR